MGRRGSRPLPPKSDINRLDLLPADVAGKVRELCADRTKTAKLPPSYACTETNHACLWCQDRARSLLAKEPHP
jgi:hypothetical protein